MRAAFAARTAGEDIGRIAKREGERKDGGNGTIRCRISGTNNRCRLASEVTEKGLHIPPTRLALPFLWK